MPEREQIDGWMFDELAHGGDEHLDFAYVEAYESKAKYDPGADLDLMRDLGLGERSTLVDIGAGTGTFALAAAPLCRRVVAVDTSAVMLTSLMTKAEKLAIDNVECFQRGFLTYAHSGAPADFVYSRNALHHLPDFWKALALERVAAILRPGGVLRLRDLIFSCDPGETLNVIEAWIGNAPERSEAGWTRSELMAHVQHEQSTFNWFLEPMLRRTGFEFREASYSTSRTYAAYTCIKA